MTASDAHVLQIPVQNLVRFYIGLIQALNETGVNGGQLNEIVSTFLHVECVACRIRVSGDELEKVAVVDASIPLSHPKLQRLRLGYCAREGCESGFYSVCFANHPDLDWRLIAEKGASLAHANEAAERAEQSRQASRKRWRQRGRLAIGIAVIIFLILLQFVVQHRRLPFTKKSHKYQIDPASVGSKP